MRRRSFVRGSIVGVGALLAGCSTRATTAGYSNDLVLRNVLDRPVTVRVELSGEIDLSLTYPLEADETARIENYVSAGKYKMTATATTTVDGEKAKIDDAASDSWDPSKCHDKRVFVRRNEIQIRSAECETAIENDGS